VIAMRFPLHLSALGTLTMAALGTPADFPPAHKLTSHPEMPDPTVMLDGAKIANQKDWEMRRRPELKALFQHYMYGQYPPRPDSVKAKILFEDNKAFGGVAQNLSLAGSAWRENPGAMLCRTQFPGQSLSCGR
jgi:hypothetical protein